MFSSMHLYPFDILDTLRVHYYIACKRPASLIRQSDPYHANHFLGRQIWQVIRRLDMVLYHLRFHGGDHTCGSKTFPRRLVLIHINLKGSSLQLPRCDTFPHTSNHQVQIHDLESINTCETYLFILVPGSRAAILAACTQTFSSFPLIVHFYCIAEQNPQSIHRAHSGWHAICTCIIPDGALQLQAIWSLQASHVRAAATLKNWLTEGLEYTKPVEPFNDCGRLEFHVTLNLSLNERTRKGPVFMYVIVMICGKLCESMDLISGFDISSCFHVITSTTTFEGIVWSEKCLKCPSFPPYVWHIVVFFPSLALRFLALTGSWPVANFIWMN